MHVIQRIKEWYNNRTRTPSSGESRAKVIDLTGKKSRKLHITQAYSRIYYENKLKAIINDRWLTHLKSHPDDASKTGPPLAFRNKIVRELYEAESAEVKAEVVRQRDEGFSDDENEDDEDVEDGDKAELKRRANAASFQRCVFTRSYR